jgi:hypothetical protein
MKMFEKEKIISSLFYFFSFSFLVFFVLELIWPRIALSYFNPNILLFFSLVLFIFLIIKKKN